MTITILTGIEDTLALILECGSDAGKVETLLLPALRKLCSTHPDNETSRGASSSSRAQATSASETVLCDPIQVNVDPLTALNPAQHSLGMLYILAARATHAAASPENATVLLPHINAFIARFDERQVRLAADKVTQLAATFTALGDRITNPESALQLLQALSSRFLTRSDSITTLHPMLAYQYLKTGRYAEAATMLLDLPLIHADINLTPLTHSDVLQYFYYAALIYIKLDRLRDAIDALETCISSPAVAISAIHMDAYKKLVLVQLLAYGKTSAVPKYTPQVVTRTFKQLAQPYVALVAAYESRDKGSEAQLQRLVEDKRYAFEKDRNTGLVRRVVALYRQRRIQRLGDVYTGLSLDKIAHMVGVEGPDAARAISEDVVEIVSIIFLPSLYKLDTPADYRHLHSDSATRIQTRKGWIHATLTPPTNASANEPGGDWIVHFDPFGGDSYTSSSSIKLLDEKINTARQWQGLLQERDRQLEKSTAYLLRSLKIRNSRAAGGDAFSGGDDFDDGDY